MFSQIVMLALLAVMSPLLLFHSSPIVNATGGPVAAFTYNPCVMCAVVGDFIFFNGNWSMSPGGSIASYAWDFGDGTPQFTTTSPSTGHDYTLPGTGIWQVTLTVKDSTGQTDGITQSVMFNVHPDFTFQPQKPLVGQQVSFNASSSQIFSPTSLLGFQWSFGDGVSGSGKLVVHTYTAAGLYRVSLAVQTGQGDAQISKTLAVGQSAPPPPPGLSVVVRSVFGIAFYNSSGQIVIQPASLFLNMTLKGTNSTGTIFGISSGQITIGPSPTLTVQRNFTTTSGQAFQSNIGRLTITAQMTEVYSCQQQQPPCLIPNVLYQLYLTGPSRLVSANNGFAIFTRLFGFLYNSQTRIGLFFVVGIAPGDVDEDGRVDLTDLVIVASSFGRNNVDVYASANYSTAAMSPSSVPTSYLADVNGDGIVDLADLVIVASSFGASY